MATSPSKVRPDSASSWRGRSPVTTLRAMARTLKPSAAIASFAAVTRARSIAVAGTSSLSHRAAVVRSSTA